MWDVFVSEARGLLEDSRRLPNSPGGGSKEEWGRLGGRAGAWLLMGDVRPTLVPTSKGQWRFGLGTSYWLRPWGVGCLAGALAVQLMAAVSGIEGWEICSACGHFYAPRRRPRADQRRFCERCHKGKVPLKLAQQDHRMRKSRRAADASGR